MTFEGIFLRFIYDFTRFTIVIVVQNIVFATVAQVEEHSMELDEMALIATPSVGCC